MESIKKVGRLIAKVYEYPITNFFLAIAIFVSAIVLVVKTPSLVSMEKLLTCPAVEVTIFSEKGLTVNYSDLPSPIMGSVWQRDNITITVSTDGLQIYNELTGKTTVQSSFTTECTWHNLAGVTYFNNNLGLSMWVFPFGDTTFTILESHGSMIAQVIEGDALSTPVEFLPLNAPVLILGETQRQDG